MLLKKFFVSLILLLLLEFVASKYIISRII